MNKRARVRRWRRARVREFMKGKISHGECICCGREKYCLLKVGEIKICPLCIGLIYEKFSVQLNLLPTNGRLPVPTPGLTKKLLTLRPELDMPKYTPDKKELAEMAGGAVLVAPKKKKKKKDNFRWESPSLSRTGEDVEEDEDIVGEVSSKVVHDEELEEI